MFRLSQKIVFSLLVFVFFNSMIYAQNEATWDKIEMPNQDESYIDPFLFFRSQRPIQTWLDSLHSQLGKPDSVQKSDSEDSKSTTYFWHKRNFYQYPQTTVNCSIWESPYNFQVTLLLFDQDSQIIDNQEIVSKINDQFQRLVLPKAKIKKDAPASEVPISDPLTQNNDPINPQDSLESLERLKENMKFFDGNKEGYNPFAIVFAQKYGNKTYAFYLDAPFLYVCEKVGKKWNIRQRIRSDHATILAVDLDNDGYLDLQTQDRPAAAYRTEFYFYQPEKDSFVFGDWLGGEVISGIGRQNNDENIKTVLGIVIMSEAPETLDVLYKMNEKYLIVNGANRWFEPITSTIYTLENRKFVPVAAFGTMLLYPAPYQANNATFFFVQEKVNGKMQTTRQIVLNKTHPEPWLKLAEKATMELLDKYFERKK